MPVSFDVTSSTGRYDVTIASGSLTAMVSEGGERVWLVDGFFADAPWLDAAGAKIPDPIVIEADEPAKSLDRMTDLIVALRERQTTRATTLIAVGGGVVQDVSAFAASVYMRGVDWIYVPTTLLSMTDSCIGGKSSINVGRYKNIVGTFHPPVRVVVDPALAATLSADERAAGLCEAAKICLCRGPDSFATYLALDPTPAADTERLGEIITLCLQAKKWFIEIDEFDRAERLLLNFGHTFGHAIEAASRFDVTHGIAVGLGMLAALHLGGEMGRRYAAAPHVARFRDHVLSLVGAIDGLPAVLARIEPAALLDAFRSDKKHTRDMFAVILVTEDGRIERCLLPRDAATEAMTERAFARMLADWTGRHDLSPMRIAG